jgi:hypothetical protein
VSDFFQDVLNDIGELLGGGDDTGTTPDTNLPDVSTDDISSTSDTALDATTIAPDPLSIDGTTVEDAVSSGAWSVPDVPTTTTPQTTAISSGLWSVPSTESVATPTADNPLSGTSSIPTELPSLPNPVATSGLDIDPSIVGSVSSGDSGISTTDQNDISSIQASSGTQDAIDDIKSGADSSSSSSSSSGGFLATAGTVLGAIGGALLKIGTALATAFLTPIVKAEGTAIANKISPPTSVISEFGPFLAIGLVIFLVVQ